MLLTQPFNLVANKCQSCLGHSYDYLLLTYPKDNANSLLQVESLALYGQLDIWIALCYLEVKCTRLGKAYITYVHSSNCTQSMPMIDYNKWHRISFCAIITLRNLNRFSMIICDMCHNKLRYITICVTINCGISQRSFHIDMHMSLTCAYMK